MVKTYYPSRGMIQIINGKTDDMYVRYEDYAALADTVKALYESGHWVRPGFTSDDDMQYWLPLKELIGDQP